MKATTGHPVCDRLIPAAQALVWAVRTGDATEQGDAINQAAKEAGDGWQTALVLILAAMVPDDQTPGQLLAWCQADPDEYLRLRESGVDSATAARLAAGQRPWQQAAA